MSGKSFWMVSVLLLMLAGPIGLDPARADDGGVSFGGSPRLLSGHKTASMQSEVIRMNVGAQNVRVDCQFVFQNAGPACTVRMGFFDEGRGSEDPDQEMDPAHPKPPHGTFTSYASFVDGARVRTQTVRAEKEGDFWHVKTVRFGRGRPGASMMCIRFRSAARLPTTPAARMTKPITSSIQPHPGMVRLAGQRSS